MAISKLLPVALAIAVCVADGSPAADPPVQHLPSSRFSDVQVLECSRLGGDDDDSRCLFSHDDDSRCVFSATLLDGGSQSVVVKSVRDREGEYLRAKLKNECDALRAASGSGVAPECVASCLNDADADCGGLAWIAQSKLAGVKLDEFTVACRHRNGAGLGFQREMLAVARSTLAALAALRKKGVAHRDLSGANILVEGGGSGRDIRVTLADFDGAVVVKRCLQRRARRELDFCDAQHLLPAPPWDGEPITFNVPPELYTAAQAAGAALLDGGDGGLPVGLTRGAPFSFDGWGLGIALVHKICGGSRGLPEQLWRRVKAEQGRRWPGGVPGTTGTAAVAADGRVSSGSRRKRRAATGEGTWISDLLREPCFPAAEGSNRLSEAALDAALAFLNTHPGAGLEELRAHDPNLAQAVEAAELGRGDGGGGVYSMGAWAEVVPLFLRLLERLLAVDPARRGPPGELLAGLAKSEKNLGVCLEADLDPGMCITL